jgi:hypothetical protein
LSKNRRAAALLITGIGYCICRYHLHLTPF